MSKKPLGPILPLQVWLVLSHLVVLILPLAALVGTGALGKDLRNQTLWDLEHQTSILEMLIVATLEKERAVDATAGLARVGAPLSKLLAITKEETLSGIQVTDMSGRVIASSGGGQGEDLSKTDEVATALSGITAHRTRARTNSRSQPIMSPSRWARVRVFVARPIFVDNRQEGVVVVSRTPREEIQTLAQMAPRQLLLGATVALFLTVFLAMMSSYILGRSLKALAAAAQKIARGSMEEPLTRPRLSHVAEVNALTDSVGMMAQQVRERLAYISEFASNVSHEFKTPLSTLRGTMELIGDDEDMPSEQRHKFLKNAISEIDRMKDLVTGLLSLARAEQGGGVEELDLQHELELLCERHLIDVEGQAGLVLGNGTQLSSIVENLVENAFRHGGPKVALRIIAFADEQQTGFTVQDNGPGISASNLPHVFDRFFTTDRAHGGTGLGLALVRAICRRHGGSITVESCPGDTRFRVELPRIIRQ